MTIIVLVYTILIHWKLPGGEQYLIFRDWGANNNNNNNNNNIFYLNTVNVKAYTAYGAVLQC